MRAYLLNILTESWRGAGTIRRRGGGTRALSTPAGKRRVQFSQCLEDVIAVGKTPKKCLRTLGLQSPCDQERRYHKQWHGNQNGHEHGKNCNRQGNSERN